MFRTAYLRATVLVAVLLVSGCAGKRIQTAYQEESAVERDLTRLPGGQQATGTFPFHVAITLEPSLLERWAMEAVGEFEDSGRMQALIQKEIDRAMQAQMGRIQRRAGPLARRFLGRFVAPRVREVARITQVRVTTIQLEPSPDCPTCLIADSLLAVGQEASPTGNTIPGHLTLLLEIHADTSGNRIDIHISPQRVLALELDLSSLFPVAAPHLGPVMERVKQRMDDALQRGDAGKTFSMALKGLEAFDIDPPLAVEQAGIVVVPRTGPDLSEGAGTDAAAGAGPAARVALRLGLALTVAAPPGLEPDVCSPPQGEDWVLASSASLVEHLALLGIRSGRVPVRFDGRGRPDPQGAYALHLQGLSFTEGGFRLDAHLWHLRFPAWSRWYTLTGTLDAENGRIVPHTTGIERGEGDGFLLLSGAVERRILNAERVDRVVLPDLAGSGEAPAWLERVSVDRAEVHSDILCVYGTVAPAAPAGDPTAIDPPGDVPRSDSP